MKSSLPLPTMVSLVLKPSFSGFFNLKAYTYFVETSAIVKLTFIHSYITTIGVLACIARIVS